MNELKDRIVSFSYKPADVEAEKLVKKLKENCKKRGTSFSFVVLKALKEYEAKLESENNV